jgi:hypothetical protein
MAEYTIDRTAPAFYLDNRGNPVRGYQVSVTLTQWQEGHDLFVPSLEAEVIKAAADKLLAQRQALAKLSG